MKKEETWLLRDKYNGVKKADIMSSVRFDMDRLLNGEPIDYVIGWKNFLGAKIDLSHKPLIPREETEYWVNQAIQELPIKKNLHILDLFSGSGCIGIGLLKNIDNCSVDFADLSKISIKQIETNLSINNIRPDKASLILSDIFSAVDKKYDYIFANPPYIDKEKGQIVDSVTKYEPHTALFAKDGGLFFIKETILNSKNYLNKGGVLYMEIDSWQDNAIRKIARNYLIDDISFFKDQFGNMRYLKMMVN